MSNKSIIHFYFIGSFIFALVLGLTNVYTSHYFTPYIKLLIDVFTVINFSILIYANRLNKFKIQYFLFYLAFLCYFISLFLINASDQPLVFVITEYRPTIFICLLYIVALLRIPKHTFHLPKYSIHLFFIVSIYFMIQYGIFSFSGLSRREMYIFREQNFELIALCMVAIFIYHLKNIPRVKNIFILLVGITLTIAKSTSVIVAFFSAFLLKNGSIKGKIVFGLFSILIIFIVLQSRYSSLSSLLLIDRINYIVLFYNDISNHSIQNILLSFKGVQPVASDTCDALYYFEQFRSDGKCYPVIYHMIILRNLFVFGIIPTLVLNLVLYWSLQRLFGCQRVLASMIFVLLFLSGLSIAGYANGLAMFTLSWIILMMDQNLPDIRDAQLST